MSVSADGWENPLNTHSEHLSTPFEAPRVVTSGSIAARAYQVMEVLDLGSGTPAEIFERFFDPLFTTKEVGIGTGLGLSLVHGILTGLDGAIDVATTVGTGARRPLRRT